MSGLIEASPRRVPLAIGISICGGGLAADLITKSAARTMLSVGDPIAVFPGLNLALSFNRGVTFGLFPVDSTAGLAVMIALQLSIVAALALWAWRTREGLLGACLAFILAGALGNILDRLMHGAVTDFIDLHIGQWHWPAFNLADTFIVTGVVGLLIPRSLLQNPTAERNPKSET